MALEERHPDAERLAEYADGVLDADARTEIERHLAGCAECRAVVMETMAFLGDPAITTSVPAHKVVPFRSRRWVTGLAVGLAAAAALVLAVRVARPEWVSGLFGARGDRPELQELIAAVANEPTRPVEGRLSGGFKYAPPPSPTRGPGDRDVSPDVRIAIAKVEKAAKAKDSPENVAALGVAHLMAHRWDEAVDELELAASERPAQADFLNDLAAAYIARAQWAGQSEDWAKGLAAAERAVAADSGLLEARFNRALALDGLHLVSQAADAWADYRRRDTSSGWSKEAGDRSAKPQSDGDRDSHQTIRERVETELFVRWGLAFLKGKDPSSVSGALREAADAASALAREGGDCLADQNARLIRGATNAGDIATLSALARGHIAYADARRALAEGHVEAAGTMMTLAAADFARAGSAYAMWAPIYRSMALRVNREPDKALRELSAVPDEFQDCRANLRGRYYWTRGVALYVLDRFVESRRDYGLAVQAFRSAAEFDNQSSTETLLAEVEFALGNRRQGWGLLIHALGNTDVPRGAWRMLLYGGAFARADDLPETALRFQNAAVQLVEAFHDTANRPDAYLQRARMEARLGNSAAAVADLAQAERAIAGIESAGFRERNVADANSIRAELLERSDPPQSVERVDYALAYFRKTSQQIKVARLLLTRARTLQTAADLDGAHRDLHEAVTIMSGERTYLPLPLIERVQALDDARAANATLLEFELRQRADYAEAFDVAERGRATALLASFLGKTSRPALAPAPARLADDVAVLYYATLPDRVIGWVITGGQTRHFVVGVPLAALRQMVARVSADVQSGLALTDVQTRSADVFAQVIAPALPLIGSPRRLVIVPDGPLWGLPFAVAPDQGGQPLIARYPVTIAPSLAAFQMASARLSGFLADGVLAIGDGHDVRGSALPRLAYADREAAEVGVLYPHAVVLSGPAATARRVVAAVQPVVHFAGHSVANTRAPSMSALLLAPDPAAGNDGTMTADDIAGTRFVGVKVVVLATCEGAVGRLAQGESMLSLAQMFFAAGVPSVVASLWPVADDSVGFMVQFHRALREQRDPSIALQSAQLNVLREGGAVRDWAAFVAIGGVVSGAVSAREQ